MSIITFSRVSDNGMKSGALNQLFDLLAQTVSTEKCNQLCLVAEEIQSVEYCMYNKCTSSPVDHVWCFFVFVYQTCDGVHTYMWYGQAELGRIKPTALGRIQHPAQLLRLVRR